MKIKNFYLLLLLAMGIATESICKNMVEDQKDWSKEKRALYIKNQRRKILTEACNEKFSKELEKLVSNLKNDKKDLQKIYWHKRETALKTNARYQQLINQMSSTKNQDKLNELINEKQKIEMAIQNSEDLKNLREKYNEMDVEIKSKTREIYKTDENCSKLKVN